MKLQEVGVNFTLPFVVRVIKKKRGRNGQGI
jgi:hypothetical protein